MRKLALVPVLVWLGVAACGKKKDKDKDGDDQGASDPTGTVVQTGGGGGGRELPLSPLKVDCDGESCGAVPGDHPTYAGTGVGIWTYVNTGDADVTIPVTMSGAAGKTMTMIFANMSDAPIAMPAIEISSFSDAEVALRLAEGQEPVRPGCLAVPMPQFDHLQHAFDLSGGNSPFNLTPHVSSVGDTRTWKLMTGSNAATTLKLTGTLGDGRKVNFWVEDSQFGTNAVTMAHLTPLLAAFANGSDATYKVVTDFVGNAWGPHGYSFLVSANADLDVVFVDLTGFAGGYFSGDNAIVAAANANSNEALAFFIDTGMIYKHGLDIGIKIAKTAMAHELTHMVDFYERKVIAGKDAFDAWMFEMRAMMAEDFVATKLDPTFVAARDLYHADWMTGGFNCDISEAKLLSATGECRGYAMGGSFGAHLLRRFGAPLFKGLLLSDGASSAAALDALLKAEGSSFVEENRRWGASIVGLPMPGTPAGYGFPERIEGSFKLVAINGPDFVAKFSLPETVPEELVVHGLFPVAREELTQDYVENVTVPAGAALTVVVQ